MIHLITGLPGHGKTLWAVTQLASMVQAGDTARPVFVRGISGLALDHAELVGDWMDCPDGSLIIIDEAQQSFPARRSGDAPAAVRAMETHRHRGIDLMLVTQHPGLLDSHVRKLVDRHTHVFRMAGREVAMVYEWGELCDDPRSAASKALADSHVWNYPKSSFNLYDSAVLHTAKKRIPKKLVVLVAAVAGLGLCLTLTVLWVKGKTEEKQEVSNAPLVTDSTGTAPPLPSDMTAEQWLAMFTPRVPYRPESAPYYDGFMAKAAPPKLYCIRVMEGDICRCYTEQVTIYSGITGNICRKIAKDGLYAYGDSR